MAQKAAKQLAQRNVRILNRAHLITIVVHGIFVLIGILFRRLTLTSVTTYVLLSLPGLVLEWFLEGAGRPRYVPGTTTLARSGDDLEATGLTEYMWDVIYWSWACIVLVALFGDWAWWFWMAIPLYSIGLAYRTYTGVTGAVTGLGRDPGDDAPSTTSKRQQKLEKRGASTVRYR